MARVPRALVTFGALIAVAGAAHAESEDPDTEVARRHFEAGSAFYDQGNYERAIAEFEKAREAKPLPAFDYNVARAYDRLGRWREALDAYRRYIAGSPSAPDVPTVQARVHELERRVSPPPAPAPAPAPPPRPHRTWGWVWGLVGSIAAVGLAVGLGVGLGMQSHAPVPSDGVVRF